MSRENLPATRLADARDSLTVSMPTTSGQPGSDLDGGFSPYRLIHQYLRGRYAVAIICGLVLAVLMATLGWMSTKPLYRSEALIRISFDIPRVIEGEQEYRSLDVFMAFMASQQAMIKTHRILSVALQDPLWQENGYNPDTIPIDGFARDLTVKYEGGEHLKVIYDSNDPVFAATAVQSIVAAYVEMYNSMDKKTTNEKTAALASRQETLVKQLEDMDKQLRAEAEKYGSSSIDQFYETAVTHLTRVESSLIDVRIALALTDGRGEGVAALSPQQIARFDPTMNRYQAEREQLEMELQQLRLRGYGENHKQVIQAKRMLDLTESRIKEYVREFAATNAGGQQSMVPSMPVPPGQAAGPSLFGKSRDELQAYEANLLELNKTVREQVATLGAQKLKMEAMRAERAKLKEELSMVTQQIATMQLESGISGRLSVMSNGETPLLPFRDRRMHLAGAGGLVGLFLPAAAIIGYGVITRRYRYSMDASEDLAGEIPLLGILPQLPARLTDPESAADAAQCLHQIRVMLQVNNQGHDSTAYLMTSSCPGEGKTSLCAALALSFAAAGAKTLVMDADLIGQRLTRGYRMEDRPGFREAMQHGAKAAAYYSSGVPRLSIMPAGVSDGRDACAVSSKAIRKLLAALKEEFDVILVDSGPILGSLEALVVAQHVDGVVLTISREQQKPLVDRAIRQLRAVNAHIAGMVFNKAESADFKRSVGASSLRSIPRNPESSALVKAGVTSTSGFGSLVDSVQTYMPVAEVQ